MTSQCQMDESETFPALLHMQWAQAQTHMPMDGLVWDDTLIGSFL